MADMFGAPVGISQANADQAQMDVVGLRTLAEMGQQSMLPIERRLKTAQAAEAEYKLSEEQRRQRFLTSQMNNLAQGQNSASGPQNFEDHIWDMAKNALSQGFTTDAEKLSHTANEIGARRVQALTAASLQDQRALSMMGKIREQLDHQTGTVIDQPSLDAFNQSFEDAMGDPSPWRGAHFGPGVRKQMSDYFTTSDQRLKAAATQQRLQISVAAEGVRERAENFREENGLWKRNFEEQKQANKVKAQGKVIPLPTALLNAAEAMLKDQEPGMSTSDSYAAAQWVASKARQKQELNRGLDPVTAVRQAYAENREDFKREQTWGGLGKPKSSFKPRGMSKDNPLPLPANPREVQNGGFYTKDGVVYQIDNGRATKVK